MTHLQVISDTKGYTPEMMFNMTRKQFRECELPHHIKVSLLKQHIAADKEYRSATLS